jgi:hypothetical protein
MDSSKPFWLIKCERGYGDAQQRFVSGDYEGAFDGFKGIYMEKCDFRDVARIVHDYYDMAKDEWITKYKTRFSEPREGA